MGKAEEQTPTTDELNQKIKDLEAENESLKGAKATAEAQLQERNSTLEDALKKAKDLSEQVEKQKADIEKLKNARPIEIKGKFACPVKADKLDYTEYKMVTVGDTQQRVPDTTVLEASDPGSFPYVGAVEFREDVGYQIDAVRSRAIGILDRALSPKRLGINDLGEPKWEGLPEFDPSLKLYVAIWVN